MTARFLLRFVHYSSTGPLVVNPIEWHKEAESVIASAEIEDVRIALLARLEERYGIGSGALPLRSGELNYLTEPLLGVTATDAQRLAALKYLECLHEQLSWTRQYFEQRLKLVYRGSRPFKRFVDRLLGTVRLCNIMAAEAKSAEVRVGASLAQRLSSRSHSHCSIGVAEGDYFDPQNHTRRHT
jgi:hypothetical protein